MGGKILVGTSSWADPGFVEEWYPQGLPAKDRLPYYSERFRVVEVNSSFYAVPERDTVGRWARITPDEFIEAAQKMADKVKVDPEVTKFTRE